MTPRTALFLLGILALPTLGISGCSPAITTHGNMLPPHKIGGVTPQVTTRAELEQNWGPPTATSTFDNNTWYYIGETDSQKGIFEREIEKRQLIKVTFDAEDKVTAVTTMDPKKGKDLDLVARRTPAAGKDYTLVQQFLFNLGRFNKSDDAKKK